MAVVVVLAAVVLAAVGCWVAQQTYGLGITGMNNSNSWGLYIMALTITSVSSQTERFCGSMSPHDSACMISARLLMLFDAGRAIVALIVWGAVIVYCMMLFVFLSIFRVRFSQCSEFVSLYAKLRKLFQTIAQSIENKNYIVLFFYNADSSDSSDFQSTHP